MTATLLIPVIVIGVLFTPNMVFSLLIALFVGRGAWEWGKLIKISRNLHQFAYILLIIFILAIAYLFRDTSLGLVIILIGIAWWLSAFILVVLYQHQHNLTPSSKMIKAGIGLLVLVPAWMSLVLLQDLDNGPSLVLFLFIIIWTADSAAYFVGSYLGKRRFASRISPGKSWEGVIGALLVSFLVGLAYGKLTAMQDVSGGILTLCVVTVIFSILGDLTESMFKRIANIKDSSHILPGHGGVLDRIDSLTSAAPVYVAGLYMLGEMK